METSLEHGQGPLSAVNREVNNYYSMSWKYELKKVSYFSINGEDLSGKIVDT